MKLSGIHHIAIMAKDMKEHIEFFGDVLGAELAAIFPMHGVPGGIHAFMRLNDHCYFSMVQIEAGRDVPIEIGSTHAGTGAGVSAPGTMQHLAFRVETEADLLAMRDRIRSKGYNIVGPLDHGMCKSMYFAGPDNLTLEIAVSCGPVDHKQWVDPETLNQIGLTMEEAQRFIHPEASTSNDGSVKQPDYDPSKYHQSYPEPMYQAMLKATDEQIAAAAQFNEPPIPAK